MRQALGLDKRPATPHQATAQQTHDPSRQRRRFAQDGEVPVVMLNRGRDADGIAENKLATLTSELREERASRARADRALEEAHLTIQSLQTKIAHTQMTYEEKLGTERQLRLLAEAALAESLHRAPAPVISAPAVMQPVPQPSLQLEAQPAPAALPVTPALKIRTAVKRAAKPKDAPAAVAAEIDDAQPIEWWLPSFRAGRKTPAKKKSLG